MIENWMIKKDTRRPQEKANDFKKLAKFYGGKSLKGTVKQRSWGEAVRYNILVNSKLSDEDKAKLVTIGGITDNASFWIDNRNVKVNEFYAENIVACYRDFVPKFNDFEQKLINTGSHYPVEIEKLKNEIKELIDKCTFKFVISQ